MTQGNFLTLCHSSFPAAWNSSKYPKIFPLPVSVGGSHDRVTDSLVKSIAFRFTGGLGFTREKKKECSCAAFTSTNNDMECN